VSAIDGVTVADIVRGVADEIARMHRAGDVRVVRRGPEGPTTNVDLFAENALVERLTGAFGPAQFVAEERNDRANTLVDGDAPRVWIIDPLDGTANFLSGSDFYGVQVAAYGSGGLLGAWVACPDLGWQASAWEGGEFSISGVTDSPVDGRVVIASGDFDDGHRAFLRDRERGYARSRSCACEYLLLCAGLLDSSLYRRTYPWDHAPGAYLVSRSGGSSLRWDGSTYDPAVAGTGILSTAAGVDIELVRARQIPAAG